MIDNRFLLLGVAGVVILLILWQGFDLKIGKQIEVGVKL